MDRHTFPELAQAAIYGAAFALKYQELCKCRISEDEIHREASEYAAELSYEWSVRRANRRAKSTLDDE